MNRRWWVRFALFGLPLLAWMALLFVGSGERARYEASWLLLQRILDFLCPEFAPPGGAQLGRAEISMYQLNGALRRVAHIAGYAVLSCLTVRFFQRGEKKLKRRSLLAAVVVSILYTGGDELHRAFERNRHAHWLDLGLNLAGTLLVLTGTLFWFWLKNVENAASDPLPEPTTPTIEED